MYKHAKEIREANEQRREWNKKLLQLCYPNNSYTGGVFEYAQNYVRNADHPVSISELVRETGLNSQAFSLTCNIFPHWAGFVPSVEQVTQQFFEADEKGNPLPNGRVITITKKRRVWTYVEERDRS